MNWIWFFIGLIVVFSLCELGWSIRHRHHARYPEENLPPASATANRFIAGTVSTRVCASWYGKEFAGQRMANGWRYNPELMTCASNHFPLGTLLSVTWNGKSVVVRVTDRMGNSHPSRELDLSEAAARKLGMLAVGVCIVRVTVSSLPTRKK